MLAISYGLWFSISRNFISYFFQSAWSFLWPLTTCLLYAFTYFLVYIYTVFSLMFLIVNLNICSLSSQTIAYCFDWFLLVVFGDFLI